jgi:hypothetical protein
MDRQVLSSCLEGREFTTKQRPLRLYVVISLGFSVKGDVGKDTTGAQIFILGMEAIAQSRP